MTTKPLIFLDVDGVINDLNMLHALGGAEPPVEYVLFPASHGDAQYAIYMPKYLPELIQELVTVADIQWLTTWRCHANGEIRENLGIEELPCIDDGSNQRRVDWKWESAKPVAVEAMEAGRVVYWVEDFGVDIQARYAHEAGVICWDTSLTGYVLREDNLRQLISECRKVSNAG